MSSLDVVSGYVEFAAAVRDEGLPVGTARTLGGVEALSRLDPTDLVDVYWAGRLTMCASRDDLDRYDTAFAQHFEHVDQPRSSSPVTVDAGSMPTAPRSRTVGHDGEDHVDAGEDEVGAGASDTEVLKYKDFASLSGAERAELNKLIRMLEVHPSLRRSMRADASRRGRIHPRHSLRAMARQGGELAEPVRYTRARRRRRTVFLLDVSGSMRPYADALVRLAHAGVVVAPRDTEVFTIGTQLSRVTKSLRERDPNRALRACYAAVHDWEGGTRLGDALAHFASEYGRSGMARGAVVVIASDGWERGDATKLGREMCTLALLAHRVLWIHPYQGKPGFVPSTNGMTAALPHIDALIAGHSLESFERAAELIANA